MSVSFFHTLGPGVRRLFRPTTQPVCHRSELDDSVAQWPWGIKKERVGMHESAQQDCFIIPNSQFLISNEMPQCLKIFDMLLEIRYW